ncbi:MAG TPA: AzlD domain-containing protein, partial [Candidatus Atribacteria bacterium]|nr:AzlD domain-containing protein [Candidatus Atribacteria bacterium]
MMIVTFIPRYLPFLAFSKLNIPRPLKKLLR